MELKVNLLEDGEKSYGIVAFGFVYFLIVIVHIITGFIKQGVFIIRTADVAQVLTGISFITMGLGYKFGFLGKAYILINSEIISLKSSIWNKEQLVYWNEINSIDIESINLKSTKQTVQA